MSEFLPSLDIIQKVSNTLRLGGINGATCIFLWISPPESTSDSSSDSLAGSLFHSEPRLYGVKSSPGVMNLEYMAQKMLHAARNEKITAAAVMTPDIEYAEVVERELNVQIRGMGIRVRTYIYDYIEEDEGDDREWAFEVDVANLGEVVTHRIS